jgi:hypothetical protein
MVSQRGGLQHPLHLAVKTRTKPRRDNNALIYVEYDVHYIALHIFDVRPQDRL